jgi:hypothetical protein
VWVAFPLSFVIKHIAARLLYRRDRWANVGADV